MLIDNQKLSKQAYEALKKIKSNKKNIRDSEKAVIEEQNRRVFKKRTKQNFKEYDQEKFEEKIRQDMFIYNKLLDNVSSEYKEDVGNLLKDMITEVQKVYKFINIEPKVNLILDDTSTNGVIYEEAGKFINDFLKREYYDLTTEEKNRKYKDQSIMIAKEILESNVDNSDLNLEEVLQFSNKSIVLKKLIKNINFPYVIEHKISEVFEDNLYNEFFEMEDLNNALEIFETKLDQFSKVVSLII